MDYMHLIADENGPRMSGSLGGYRRAAVAAVAAFRAAGIEKAAIEPSGHFGRGWDWTRVAVQMKAPQETTLSAYPADWPTGPLPVSPGNPSFFPYTPAPESGSRSSDGCSLAAAQLDGSRNDQSYAVSFAHIGTM